MKSIVLRMALASVTCLVMASCITIKNRDKNTPGGDEYTDAEKQALQQKLTSLKTPDNSPRKRILILPILNDSTEKDPSVVKTAKDALLAGLRLTDNYVVIDNSDLPKDLSKYKKDNGYDLSEISKIAADLGVSAVLESHVLEIRTKKNGDEVGLIRQIQVQVTATASVKVFSAFNRKEILNEVRSATSETKNIRVAENERVATYSTDPQLITDAITGAMEGMVPSIVKATEKIGWNAKIALVNGDRIYLNAGRLTGLNVGDILRVSELGNDVFDPETGLMIGQAPGRMKGTLEVISYFGKDGAVAVVHSGSGFKENDHVELY